jgi:L-alanine-DL-glutamate epimerase-like enolase superfamily enzyme
VGGLGVDLARDAIAVRARELKAAGFRTFKVKIGQKDMRQDIERVRAVRESVGEDAIIRVDGNAAYSVANAHSVLRELACLKIGDAEQPLARGDLKRLAELRKSSGITIAAQESVSSPEDALRVLQEDAADLVKIKLTHIGGFQNGIQVAAIFGANGLPVVVGQGSACTPILSAAEMHLHASLKNAQPGGEMTGFLRLGEQAVIGSIKVQNARAILNDKPGLGIEVNKQEVMQIPRGF